MMHRRYLQHLYFTLSQPKYYLTLLKTGGWKSLKFFIISMTILGWLAATHFSVVEVGKIDQQLTTWQQQLIDHYPAKLVINWNGSKLQVLTQTNQDHLDELALKKDNIVIDNPATQLSSRYQLPEKLIVITNNQDLNSNNLDELVQDDTLMVASPNSLWMKSGNQNWQDFPWREFPGFDQPFTINKNNFPEVSQQVLEYLTSVIFVAQLLLFAMWPLGLILSRLWIVTIESVFAFLISKINRWILSYRQVFQWSLHISVVAELINQLAGWLYPQHQLPMFSLSFWAIMIFLMFSLRTQLSKPLPSTKPKR